MSVGLAWKSASKSNQKLVNQKLCNTVLSWMPIKYMIVFFEGKNQPKSQAFFKREKKMVSSFQHTVQVIVIHDDYETFC